MPKFGSSHEILFVEGNSSDGTFEECERALELTVPRALGEIARNDNRSRRELRNHPIQRGNLRQIGARSKM